MQLTLPLNSIYTVVQQKIYRQMSFKLILLMNSSDNRLKPLTIISAQLSDMLKIQTGMIKCS